MELPYATTCAILAPNVGPTSNISILDKFATVTVLLQMLF